LDGFALVERAGAEDEGAVGDGFGEGFKDFGVAEQVGGAYGGFGFHPIHGEGGDYAQAAEAEVGHGAGGCADVEGVARGDEDYFDAVGLGGGEQGLILDRYAERLVDLAFGDMYVRQVESQNQAKSTNRPLLG